MGSGCSANAVGVASVPDKSRGGEGAPPPRAASSDSPGRAKAELLCPSNPGFVLTRKWAAKAMIFIQSNIDDTGNGVSPVVDGWKLRQSDLHRGVPVFENQYTGERIRWIPLESASSVEGQSPDIANMKAHFCFRQYEHNMNAIHFMLDSQGNLREGY